MRSQSYRKQRTTKKKKKQAFSNNYTWSFQFKWKKGPFYEKEKKT